jgi:glyoxylase-like metal-dependent hydrolase (beta-lactamase superfamily II)
MEDRRESVETTAAQNDPATYRSSRRVGDATATAISLGVLYWAPQMQAPEEEWRRAMREADARGRIPCELTVVRIRLGAASILVDPGLEEPSSPHSETMLTEWEGMTLSPGLQPALESIGVRPEDITHILLSHGHFDHYLAVTRERDGRQVPRFPNARIVVNRWEWEGNPEREREFVERLGAIGELGMLDLVDGDAEVAPGVTLLHAPGESPGHSIVRVASAGEYLYVVGDLFHHACEVEHLDWAPAERDLAAMRASRERLLADAVPQRATIVFTHAAFPPWGRIVEADGGYRWERLNGND